MNGTGFLWMVSFVRFLTSLLNVISTLTADGFYFYCYLGFWVISMAFTLPLSKAASKLSPERPTSSILGAHTMFSACGVLALNFTFMIIALAALFHQDWYLCRRWGSTNVSSVTLIADNYEAETLFLVTGYQYISSAMAFNFGYTFRSAWIKNYTFVALALGFTIIQFYIALVPGYLSCVFRVNCSNDVSYS